MFSVFSVWPKGGLIAGLLAGVVRSGIGFVKWKIVEVCYPSASPLLLKAGESSQAWLIRLGCIDFFVGILFGLLYSLLAGVMPGQRIKKGLAYGFVIWMVCEFPGLLIGFFTAALPFSLMAAWLLSGIVTSLIIGLVIVVVYERIGESSKKES